MSEPSLPSDPARLDALLARTVAKTSSVRHGLAAVAADNGSWEWFGASGVLQDDGEPATIESRYPVASVTKLFTATVVMQLVEQGALALDTRMVDVLGSGSVGGLHILDGVDHTPVITVENLLAHTSGLPDYYEDAPRGQRSAQARLLSGEDAPMPFDEVLAVVRAMKPYFAPMPAGASGGKAKYSDTNYQLLGAIVEAVTGQELPETFENAIFRPLGLADTSSFPHQPASGRAPAPDAAVYAGNTRLLVEGALSLQKADGGIVSTLRDQVTFMRALVSGSLFRDESTWDLMQLNLNRVFFPVEYGLGLMRYAPSRLMSPFFAIPPLVGHTGSTATWLFHCPSENLVLAGAFDVAKPPLPFRFLPRLLQAVG